VLSEVKAEDLEKFKTSDKVVVVGFYDDAVEDHKDEHDVLNKVAKELSEDAVFGYTEATKSAEEHGVKQPALILFKQFDEGKVIYEGKFEPEDIKKFVAAHKTPMVDEIGPENFMSYVDSGLPLAYLFLDDDDQRTPLIDALKPIAKEYKGKINFVWIDATKYAGHAGNLNLDESWPAFAIQEPKEQTKFPMSQKEKLKAENVREFVDQYVKGEIKPSIKSEPIPEKNDEPVKVVVADEFDKIVMDKEKDVLMEFYAPWCGHCKKLVPIYDELGKKFAAHSDKIVIGKMDSTANDIPPGAGFSVSGFPTLKLIKAGTNEVVEYEGDRSLESLTKFMLENSTNKVELKEEAEDKKEADKEDKKEEDKEEKEEKEDHDEL
jgi:protein disulfide-isomerase A1